jgi:hypothetical protein
MEQRRRREIDEVMIELERQKWRQMIWRLLVKRPRRRRMDGGWRGGVLGGSRYA